MPCLPFPIPNGCEISGWHMLAGDKKPEKQSMKGNAPSLVDDTPDVSAGSKRRRASNDLIEGASIIF